MAQTKHNRYTRLKLKLLQTAWHDKKISLRKLWNASACSFSARLRMTRSGPAPALLSLELGNACNARCLFCRTAEGVIFNTNPAAPANAVISQGQLPLGLAKTALTQLKDDLLIAILYTNGEPLLYKDLPELVDHASTLNTLSMIATNGILLTPEKTRQLLDAGISFIKIQLSGMTQDIYNIQVRQGAVETIKENIRHLTAEIKQKKISTHIMIDWISYTYNAHQLPQIRQFCADLGLMLNIRPGNPRGGLEQHEPALSLDPLPLPGSCEWPYLGMQINFNGDILPCCDAVTWHQFPPLGRFIPGENNLKDIWNAPGLRAWRQQLAQNGREAIPLCARCYRRGVEFKW